MEKSITEYFITAICSENNSEMEDFKSRFMNLYGMIHNNSKSKFHSVNAEKNFDALKDSMLIYDKLSLMNSKERFEYLNAVDKKFQYLSMIEDKAYPFSYKKSGLDEINDLEVVYVNVNLLLDFMLDLQYAIKNPSSAYKNLYARNIQNFLMIEYKFRYDQDRINFMLMT